MAGIIQIDRLTCRFNEVIAVNNLSLEVEAGEIFGLVGPDGAGKTTTMRLLCGVLDPSAGDARVAGLSIRTHGEEIKGRIGYMPQRFGLYGDLSVTENIHFYADIYQVPRKERAERIKRLLYFSQLEPFSRRLARDLSGGMKQKLGIACALVHTPEILFLDEPTCGVDPVSRRDLWRILYELTKQGVTIFMSTAYLDEAERCTRVGFIHHGQLMVCSTPASIRARFPGEVWQIQCDRNRIARERIGAMEGVMVSLVGDTLHLIFDYSSVDMDRLRGYLAKDGVTIQECRRIPFSLEDVFLYLLHQNTGNGTRE